MKKLILSIKDYLLSSIKYILPIFLTLLYWELLLYFNIHSSLSGFTVFNVLFLLCPALVISGLVSWNKKLHNIDLLLVMILVLAFYISQLIYFKTFGSLFSVSMVGTGANAVTGFWWSITHTLKENILNLILFVLPIVLLIIDIIKTNLITKSYKAIYHPINVIMSVIVWLIVVSCLSLTGTQDYTAYGAYHSKYVDTDFSSSKLGVLPNTIVEVKYLLFGSNREEYIEIDEDEIIVEEVIEEIDYNKLDSLDLLSISLNTDDKAVKNICNYLLTLRNTNKNDYTGIFEDYNLIYICAESFSRLAIDPVVTPTLYKLANNGIVLNNYYNGFKNVTTNGEYAFLTGLWPDTAREETNMGKLTGTMGQSVDKDMSLAIGNMFNSNGYKSYGYHNYYGSYYGRNQSLPNMGFTCKFMGNGMSFSSAWPASDLEMMEQSVSDYINTDHFLAYYMTFSGHGNYTTGNSICYKNIKTINDLTKDRDLTDIAKGYLACNYELELAMTYLLDELDKAGKLDNTVIVLTGDHYPYYLSEEAYKSLNGSPLDNSFEDYKSTCIIYNSNMENVYVDEVCCNVDILPTVLNLFNIEYDSRLYAGTDVFSDGVHVAMLYNRSFISDKCKYNSNNGKYVWISQPYNLESQMDEYVDNMYSYVKKKYAYSIAVEDTDFYKLIH